MRPGRSLSSKPDRRPGLCLCLWRLRYFFNSSVTSLANSPIAQGIYQERHLPEGALDTDRMNILAGALLDAGCDDEELIQYCRREGPHVRGCWVVDAILGKT
jgi:hypothetical protein